MVRRRRESVEAGLGGAVEDESLATEDRRRSPLLSGLVEAERDERGGESGVSVSLS